MIWRIILIFPIVLFLLVRQLYANLLGANRDLLTALMLAGLTLLGLLAFLFRARESRTDLALVDAVTWFQSLVAAFGIWAYVVTARISTEEAASAFYYYCLAPFLIYAGFLFARLRRITLHAILIASAITFLITFWVAVYEVLGIDFWLFQYDRWVLNKNISGIYRASGLYGTHIDYGCLSFIAFCIAYYVGICRPSWIAKFMFIVAILGSITSMSRIWMLAIALVIVVDMIVRQTLKQRIARIAAIAILVSISLPIADELGITTIVTASDSYTQESNESRIENFSRLSKWMLRDYAIVGIGPGTQNGPGEPGDKVAPDFLWLGFIVDYGTLIGIILLLLRIMLLGYLVLRSVCSHSDQSLRRVTSALSMAFLSASFVDSAFVHPVTVSIFYMIAGFFLYCDSSKKPF